MDNYQSAHLVGDDGLKIDLFPPPLAVDKKQNAPTTHTQAQARKGSSSRPLKTKKNPGYRNDS